MKLRKPCQHGRYESHFLESGQWGKALSDYERCPGGVFLPDDTLATILEALEFDGSDKAMAVLDALSVREAE